MKPNILYGLVIICIVGVTIAVAMKEVVLSNSNDIAAIEPPAKGAAAEMNEPKTVTSTDLLNAGFKRERNGYSHPDMSLDALRSLVGSKNATVKELRNSEPGFPEATFEFPGGACNLTYTERYHDPQGTLNDGTNRVRVYLWFYEPELKK